VVAREHAFAVLAEPNRRLILDLLLEQPRSVGELVRRTGLSQPGTSKHLKVLRDVGLVHARVAGQQRVYEVNADPLREIDTWLAPYRRLWSASLARLEQQLDRIAPETKGASK
jgi:DNA-binding transcriptional ArsR family regulator